MEKTITEQLQDLVDVQNSHGNWNFDRYMHGMANGLILALSILKNEEPKYLEAPTQWLSDDERSIPDLVALQTELGYVQGDISTVGMLGLVGEAGEVLNEMHIGNNGSEFFHHVMRALDSAKTMDNVKKDVRKKKIDVSLHLTKQNEEKFDSELADTYYYLQILATNRGLTIPQLAKMAYDKVRAKQAAGGSSEDKKS